MNWLRGDVLDASCPVEWGHPLNLGLACELSVPPLSGWRNSLKWKDLVRGGHKRNDATLTNGPTWSGPKGRPGGFGAVNFDGTDDYALGSTSIISTVNFTFHAWFNQTTAASNAVLCDFDGGNNGGFELRFSGTSKVLHAILGYPNTGWAQADGAVVCNLGQWYLAGLTYDGANAKIYVNGKLDTSFACTATQVINKFIVGSRQGSLQFYNGSLDGNTLHGRCFSAGEEAAWYAESKRGNPERWRWISTKAWFVPSVAPASITMLPELFVSA